MIDKQQANEIGSDIWRENYNLSKYVNRIWDIVIEINNGVDYYRQKTIDKDFNICVNDALESALKLVGLLQSIDELKKNSSK